MITAGSRPRLAGKARLRVDPRSGKHMLLYPERGLELTESAARIAKLCGQGLTVAAIVDKLAAAYADADHERIEAEVVSFLESLDARGLLAPETP
ncbi:MAG TPA: pyrroloquinoline quinone biosynthesis peptide chaperone PqqD [Polyangia bacterium]|jgi:coenzyme PQQ biosynthesis protein PqqD|nr:pyrroloquinoline quinone biosynthesis peptide chaperone PqqD [Polyangia bacterium]